VVEPGHVEVYGQDHSPWVQAVLLGLHEKSIPHTVRTAPPLRLFLRSGVMMPAARIGRDSWRLNSDEILEELGFAAVSPEDMRALNGAWRGVGHRIDQPTRFWHRFSWVRDSSPTLLARLRNHFFRSFAVLYLFLLIRVFVPRGANADPEDFANPFRVWEEKLEQGGSAFLGGADPGSLDLLLFGIIQCHCSIPVPPIDALVRSPQLPRLRAWIGAMHERFVDYPHLYSGVYLAPHSAPPLPAPLSERGAFWLGAAAMLIAFPVTVPLVFFYALRIRRLGIQGAPAAKRPD
jgi:hypothetical protein